MENFSTHLPLDGLITIIQEKKRHFFQVQKMSQDFVIAFVNLRKCQIHFLPVILNNECNQNFSKK